MGIEIHNLIFKLLDFDKCIVTVTYYTPVHLKGGVRNKMGKRFGLTTKYSTYSFIGKYVYGIWTYLCMLSLRRIRDRFYLWLYHNYNSRREYLNWSKRYHLLRCCSCLVLQEICFLHPSRKSPKLFCTPFPCILQLLAIQ